MSDHSRALALAAGVTGTSESALERRLRAQHVTVSLSAETDSDVLAARVLLQTLRRGPGNLHVLDDGSEPEILDDLRAAAHAIDPEQDVDLVQRPTGIYVHVGEGPAAQKDVIHVVPDGHGVHLSRTPTQLRRNRQPNALGAVFTAAVGAAEVFKLAADVLPSRRILRDELQFCPVAASADLTLAPAAPDRLELDLMLVGLGAVGSATALILGQLFGDGVATLVDPEVYECENLGTYSLGTAKDVVSGTTKVSLAAQALSGWRIDCRQDFIEQVIGAIDNREVRWPDALLCGVDSIEARHAAQHVWPDLLIDAATGDTAVGIHVVSAAGTPCLACLVPQPGSATSSTARLAELTGLDAGVLARGDVLLTHEHLGQLADNDRERLVAFVGEPICGLARAFGLSAAPAGSFRPSVPFVSQQAACLGVGRLLAIKMGLLNEANVFQYDALLGPTSSTALDRKAVVRCYCGERGATIARIRELRRSPRGS